MSDLPKTTDSLDRIAEEHRKFYQKGEEGAYLLDPEAVANSFLETNKALKSERKIRTDAERKNKEFEGFDKSDYERLRAKQAEWDSEKEQRERETLEAKGRYEEALAKAKETHTKAIDTLKNEHTKTVNELTEKVNHTQGSMRNYILDDQLRRAISKSGVFAEDIDDVLTLTKNRFELGDDNQIVVKDDAGRPQTGVTVDAYFADTFKKARPKFYQGSGASGSGASAGKSNAANLSQVNPADLTPTQKIQLGLAQQKR